MNKPDTSTKTNKPRLLGRIIKEPLFQFTIIGAALFAAFTFFNDDKVEVEDNKITIDTRQIKNLAVGFKRVWLREPTKTELDGLVQGHLKEEILYREALKLGLDKNDIVIRRHLGQKMSFLSNDLAELPTPTDEILQKSLDDQKERYKIPPKATFIQLYFKPDDAASTRERIQSRLESLSGKSPGEVALETIGDRTMLPGGMRQVTPDEIAKVFGKDFAGSLFELPDNQWMGPVESGFGLHLVFIEDRVSSALPKLSDVRKAVEREWRTQQQQVANDRFFQFLKDKYEIEIETVNPNNS